MYEKYGPPEVLQLKEIEKPTPKDNEVLIKTHVATVTSGDRRVRSLDVPAGFGLIMRLVFGFSRPKQPILGTELAGVIESVGRDVRAFKSGDRVFAFTDAAMGCYAEYKCMPEDGAEVTAVCGTANVNLVKSLGADHVIDYTKEDFTQNGITYNIIIDTAGTAPYRRSKNSLKEGGRLLLVLAKLSEMLSAPWSSMISGKKIIAGPASGGAEELRFLADLAGKGEFRPVIDRRYPLDQIVEAHRYVDTGRKRGNVVITFAQISTPISRRGSED